jgi:hypothetical protein
VSDEVITPSAETEPTPVETKEPAAEPKKPRTIDDDLEDVFKKHGGAAFKAGGKERKATTWAETKRHLSRVAGTDDAATEALRVRAEAEGITSTAKKLASLPKAERIKALEKLGFKKADIYEAFEDEVLTGAQKREEQSKLTERERQLQADLEDRDARLADFTAKQEAAEAERREAAEAAEGEALYKELSGIAGQALQKAKVSAARAHEYLPAIARRMDQAKKLGLDISPDEIASEIMESRGVEAREHYTGLDVGAMADEFEAMQVDDPDAPGKKTSKANLLKREWRRRIEARNGVQSVPVRAAQPTNGASKQTAQDKWDAARTFGG